MSHDVFKAQGQSLTTLCNWYRVTIECRTHSRWHHCDCGDWQDDTICRLGAHIKYYYIVYSRLGARRVQPYVVVGYISTLPCLNLTSTSTGWWLVVPVVILCTQIQIWVLCALPRMSTTLIQNILWPPPYIKTYILKCDCIVLKFDFIHIKFIIKRS